MVGPQPRLSCSSCGHCRSVPPSIQATPLAATVCSFDSFQSLHRHCHCPALASKVTPGILVEKFGYLISYRGSPAFSPFPFLSLSLCLFPSCSLSLLFFFLLSFFYAFQNISYHSLDYSLAALALPSLTPRAVHHFSHEEQPLFLVELFIVSRGMTSLRERGRLSCVYVIPFCRFSNASVMRDQAKDYSLSGPAK